VSLARRSAISLFSSCWSVIAFLVSWLLIWIFGLVFQCLFFILNTIEGPQPVGRRSFDFAQDDKFVGIPDTLIILCHPERAQRTEGSHAIF
jgi:hypothetical protein